MPKKLSPLKLAKYIVSLSCKKKAKNILILDIKKICSFCDYFVIMTGLADVHIKSLTEQIILSVKKEFNKVPHHIEGEKYNRWVIIDYIDVVVHIMDEETREFYTLEKIWSKGKIVRYDRKNKKSAE
ncbi:MAG: ribosome silencing factor [Endomicrobia bacterium]|nr:ribosome silencing factor [Endomicrobiia bacterium]